ncbi:MAG: endonuclease III [Syntrophobacterales bacterium]|jgi:endonuclease-3|nr:endonuclease III [Syntrophobacterales bacterium]
MNKEEKKIETIIALLEEEASAWDVPIVTQYADNLKGPFTILISTILSLRTKDEVTEEASRRLFALADTPEAMAALEEEDIQKAIYPVGFYRNKAKTIIEICRTLQERYHSLVPDSLDELLTLKGVGRKTANLVMTLGYGKEGICVDTHVHRISNRLGYVAAKSPDETEFALRNKLPKKYWIRYNTLMVAFGRNVCRPVSPLCSCCVVASFCDREGVVHSR